MVMSESKVSPLLLLLLAWTFPTRVHCQNVTVGLVATNYVEVNWLRQLLWLGVTEFQINFTATDTRDCIMTVPCDTVTCTFNSIQCGLLFPCTPTTLTISGGDYTASTLSLVTSPEPVTNFSLSLEEGVEYISWVNPSNDSSPCFEHTAVRFSFNGEDSVSYFSLDEENMSKPLCEKGSGEVEVWTEGGDGHSTSSSGEITYHGSSVIDLVRFEKCEPVGCSAMELEWSYNPVCPDVVYLELEIDDVTQIVSTNTTNLTVTGLKHGFYYEFCISAMTKDGEKLDSSCMSQCETPEEVPEDLFAEPLSSSSLRVTWNSPMCPLDSEIVYELTVYSHDYTTAATTYDVGGLSSFTNYEVTVKVIRKGNQRAASTNAYTLLQTPLLNIDSVQEDSVDVSWNPYPGYTYGYDIYYTVMWGNDLQHRGLTKKQSFTITGFNSTDKVLTVCVVVFPQGREDLTSQGDCKNVSDSSSLGPGAIAGIVLGALFLLSVVVIAFTVAYKKRNTPKALRQQQQQQQQ